MIQFLGLELDTSSARVVSVGRDLAISAEYVTPIAGLRPDADGLGASVPPAEWRRSATFALRETYLALPVARRKIWGLALAGPSGWIALDLDFEPLGDVRLVPPARVLEDLSSWLEEDRRLANRVAAVLSPKDWLRFVLSRGLGTDASEVSRLGALGERGFERGGATDWSTAALDTLGIERRWLPPVFESTSSTGRLTEEGIRLAGIPGSVWVAAGAETLAARLAGAADLRDGKLLRIMDSDGTQRAVATSSTLSSAAPEGWAARRAAWTEHRYLERLEPLGADGDLSAASAELQAFGVTASTVETHTDGAIGAALIAGVASGLLRWDRIYSRAAELFAPASAEPDGTEPASTDTSQPGDGS